MALNSNIEFRKINLSTLRDVALSGENLSYLLNDGFLGWVSPHLYFGEFENAQLLPTLANWSWLKDWGADKALALEMYGNFLVVGSGPDNEPLVTKPNESPIFMVSSSLELLLLNTNLRCLTATASAFLDMVDKAYEIDPSSIQHCKIPPHLINGFVTAFTAADEQATSQSIWLRWANERSKNFN